MKKIIEMESIVKVKKRAILLGLRSWFFIVVPYSMLRLFKLIDYNFMWREILFFLIALVVIIGKSYFDCVVTWKLYKKSHKKK